MYKHGKEKVFGLPGRNRVIIYISILFVIIFSGITMAAGGGECIYKGTLRGEYNGDVMGQAVRGTFTINISADGTVTGSFTGYDQGAITGSVSDTGALNARGQAGIAEWTGKLSISEGRLSGKGSWKGFNGGGLWWSE